MTITQVDSTTKSPDTILVSVVISNPSTVTAYDVTIDFDISNGMTADYSTFGVNTTVPSEIILRAGYVRFSWVPGNISGRAFHPSHQPYPPCVFCRYKLVINIGD